RAAARHAEDGPDPLAAAAELPPGRRQARGRARAPRADERAPLLRVPPPELVRGGGLRTLADTWCGARDRRPPRGQALPGARVHDRLDVRPLPLRLARPSRQLLRA